MNLAELIRHTKGDRSYERLARDCGGTPTAARLQQIATSTRMKSFPDAPTLAALARGLGVPVRTVVLAAAESLGLQVGGSSVLGDLLPPAPDLTDRQVAAVLAVVNAMNDGVRGTLAATESIPLKGTPPAGSASPSPKPGSRRRGRDG